MFVILTIRRRCTFKKYIYIWREWCVFEKRLLFSIGYNWNEVEIRPQWNKHHRPDVGVFAGSQYIFRWLWGNNKYQFPHGLPAISDSCRVEFMYKPARVQNTCIVLSVDFRKSPHVFIFAAEQQALYTQILLNRTAMNQVRNETSLYICLYAATLHARCKEEYWP